MSRTEDWSIGSTRRGGRRLPRFILHADRAIADTARTRLLRAYLAAAAQSNAGEAPETTAVMGRLPEETVHVRLRAKRSLPGKRIGAFRLGSPALPARRWEIEVAFGPAFTDEIDAYAWLATVPHEFYHLAEFVARHGGRKPIGLSLEEFRTLDVSTDEEHAAEAFARQVLDQETDLPEDVLADPALYAERPLPARTRVPPAPAPEEARARIHAGTGLTSTLTPEQRAALFNGGLGPDVLGKPPRPR